MNPFIPCIDLGHGGQDLGAVRPVPFGDAQGVVREKDINLHAGKLLNASFAGTNIVPVMTRQADFDPSWGARYRVAKEAGAQFVLSIHCNAHATASHLDGAEAYHYAGNITTARLGRRWLETMPRELRTQKLFAATSNPGPEDDWLQNPLAVINAFKEIPVVLAEICYLSNQDDLDYIMSPHGLDAIVCSLRSLVVDAARVYCS